MKRILFFVFFAVMAMSQSMNHTLWDNVLKRHVVLGTLENEYSTIVDYAGIARDVEFQQYIDLLDTYYPNSTLDETQALLINTYNAYAIHVVNSYGCKVRFGKYCWPVKSIQDIGTILETVWNFKHVRLGGKVFSLGEIEKAMLLSMTHSKPNVHASLVCASISCPFLRREAFTGDMVRVQMQEQMMQWIRDPKGFQLDRSKNIVSLSSIFDWYRLDFESSVNGTLIDYLLTDGLLDPKDSSYLQANRNLVKIQFIPYNWRLNHIDFK